MNDFWDSVRAVESTRERTQATSLRDKMLAAQWGNLSTRDSIEFFNELLRLDELFPGLLAERADAALRSVWGDSRTSYKQDQVSKAQILYSLASHISVEDLLSVLRDTHQDLDTRNAAIRILWERSDASDDQAVAGVRDFLRELLPSAQRHEHPEAAFVVGLCYLLLCYQDRDAQDDAVVKQVYSMNHLYDAATESGDIAQWLRTQFTMCGLRRDVMRRGGGKSSLRTGYR